MHANQFFTALRQYEHVRQRTGRDFTEQVETLVIMHAPVYAAEHGITEDEARAELQTITAREYNWQKA